MRIDLKIDAVAKRIHAEINASGTTLTRFHRIGPINAALIIGEVDDVSRFPSRDHFASHTGTGEIIRTLTINPTKRYHGTGRPPGGPKGPRKIKRSGP